MCVSGAIAFFSGFIFALPSWILIPLVLVWGFFVIADSPQFSAMAVLTCPEDYTGTALTIQNGIGFAITVLSIQMLPLLARSMGWRWAFTILAPGPFLGALAIIRLGKLPNRGE
jgi:MFS family permease